MSVRNSLLPIAGTVLTGLGAYSKLFVPDECKAAIARGSTVLMDNVCPWWATTDAGLLWIILAGGVVMISVGVVSWVQTNPRETAEHMRHLHHASELFKREDK
jgi:hypothetical protein